MWSRGRIPIRASSISASFLCCVLQPGVRKGNPCIGGDNPCKASYPLCSSALLRGVGLFATHVSEQRIGTDTPSQNVGDKPRCPITQNRDISTTVWRKPEILQSYQRSKSWFLHSNIIKTAMNLISRHLTIKRLIAPTRHSKDVHFEGK
jgi:hypothetical protein